MKMFRLFSVLAVCAAMLFAGCSKGNGSETKTYTITVTGDANGNVSTDKATAEAGMTVTLIATANSGCDFVKWTVESGGAILSPNTTSRQVVFTMPASNVIVKAEFTLTKYAVTVTSSSNGTAVADKEGATEGETIKLTATPANGYSFDKWMVESGGITLTDPAANPATFTMPAGNVSVKAEFIEGIKINGVTWAYTNVDAPGTFAAKPEYYGMYYQWNRRTGWSSTNPLTSYPAGITWAATNADGHEWEAANDPCPAGWRVPTKDECVALCNDAKATNEMNTLNGVNGYRFTDYKSRNSVFFPLAGNRYGSDGGLYNVGNLGFYWSASSDDTISTVIGFLLGLYDDGEVIPDKTAGRGYCFPVRCVAK